MISCFSGFLEGVWLGTAGAFVLRRHCWRFYLLLLSVLQAKQGEIGCMDEWGFVALLKMEGFLYIAACVQ